MKFPRIAVAVYLASVSYIRYICICVFLKIVINTFAYMYMREYVLKLPEPFIIYIIINIVPYYC